jgi:hypothetical protein
MSWLDDRIIQYLYLDARGAEVIVEFPSSQDAPDPYTAHGHVYKKVRMLPFKTNLTFRVQFERNGLIAYKYDSGDGKPRTVSATRENYEHNIGNTSNAKLKEMKDKGELSRAAPSITTKGYKETYKKVKAKKGA